MNCPKCEGTLSSKAFSTVEYDQCGGCDGMWFDLLEHEDLKKLAGSERIDDGESKGAALNARDLYDCPKCAQPMVRLSDAHNPGLRYESCGKCYGFFFDAGEFKQYKGETLLERIKKVLTKG